ncbi:putative bifunctional diguanylate cyclase/phosphodiesterase [Cohaesibacter gelatinilyticus]|uniref:Diguanylate cyclase/phosphodiesterase n=1 Tax=Cohaesibacter gelatinilyticus TaxID=372072 RepID=A0A285NES8_9HYPH|nr:bifunctional diguanylate cyclase/phosphodiesterase [Cohaesibacter gelatinilyticus]SNZ06416.1 diguanylate cyclase/phosphodiesterase [Cohaesibacter gelatinilyticus]
MSDICPTACCIKDDAFNIQSVLNLTTPLWVFDIDHSHVVWANDAAVELWHADNQEDLYKRDMGADMSASIAERLRQYQSDFIADKKTFSEVWTLYPNGHPHTYRVMFRGYVMSDGRMGMLCEAKAEEQETPERLRSAEALNHIPIAISLFSKEGIPLYTNAAARSIYGSSTIPLKERFVDQSTHTDLVAQLERKQNATLISQVWTEQGIRWHEISARNCHDAVSGNPAYILSEVDVTELKDNEHKVRYLAHHDTLTGLYNRNYVQLAFPELLSSAKQSNLDMAMMLIDLDKFKTINDTLGHASGDQLLMHVSQILEQQVGSAGHIARLGGDEFIILIPMRDKNELNQLCHHLLKAIATDCHIEDHRLSSKASIGVSLFPEHGDDLATLMKHADLALYDSKDRGRNTFSFFRPALQMAVLKQRSLERDLIQATQRKEFLLHYQPRVCCRTNEVRSIEALLRWNHPNRGVLLPGHFVDTLEETGLIHDVGTWVAEQVGHDQRTLTRAGFDIPVSINVSPKQFDDHDLCHELVAALAQSNCPTDRIELEITESMLMGDKRNAKATLSKLRAEGFSISIDDFGTGYSNLAYIQDYPISCLKIDRSFINAIDKQAPVVNLVLSLCRLTDITAIAEGVETPEQLQWLEENKCDQYQGFIFSRPIPLMEMEKLLQDPPNLLYPHRQENEDCAHSLKAAIETPNDPAIELYQSRK